MSRGQRRRVVRSAGQEMNIQREAAYIVERARLGNAGIVTLGPLPFFSTETGDAWMLDPADQLALCLAKDGDPLPVRIEETTKSFSIEWNAHYALDGETFQVVEDSGRVRVIIGYPVDEIRRAIQRMKSQ